MTPRPLILTDTPSRLTWNAVLGELERAQPYSLTNAQLVALLDAPLARVTMLTVIMSEAGAIVRERASTSNKTFYYRLP